MLTWLRSFFKKKPILSLTLSKENVPKHIAVIMDGNGRWAEKRKLPRVAGHRMGAESVRSVVKACVEFGVKYLTVYAFSTENWKRPTEEIQFLMGLLSDTINKEIDELDANGVRIRFLGHLNDVPPEVREKIRFSEERTKNNKKLNVQIMLSYGGRAELVDAFKAMNNEQLNNDKINEDTISNHLYTKGIPDPDLLIRTAGEMRISNFLLWQIAYAELYVTLTMWPDFRREHLQKAIRAYQKRKRKFGAVVK